MIYIYTYAPGLGGGSLITLLTLHLVFALAGGICAMDVRQDDRLQEHLAQRRHGVVVGIVGSGHVHVLEDHVGDGFLQRMWRDLGGSARYKNIADVRIENIKWLRYRVKIFSNNCIKIVNCN